LTFADSEGHYDAMDLDSESGDKSNTSDDSLARPTNWRAIMTPAGDWEHMTELQCSIMTGVVSPFPS